MQTAWVRVWSSTLRELEALPPDEDGVVEEFTKQWKGRAISLGSMGRLKDIGEQVEAKHEARHIRYTRCQWRDCFCSHHPPEHKMQVCKGCYGKRYCSKTCQKRFVSVSDLPYILLC